MAFRPYYTIYTDGASRKDRRGGWGFAVFHRGVEEQHVIHEACGGEYDTTNNRMEMLAAIEALLWAHAQPRPPILTIRADSMYVIAGITEHIDVWLRTGWLGAGAKPIKNRDLWEILGELDCDLSPTWEHVKGHSGVYGNELADVLAGEGVPRSSPERHQNVT